MNIISNYKTIYYNLLTNFYLILNLILPFYDNVIISMHNQATKNLFGNIKKVKRIRMIEFLNKLKSNDKLILDKNNNLLVVEYDINDNDDDNDDEDDEDDEDDIIINDDINYNYDENGAKKIN